jgi:adenosylcobinamide-GDP ribazoletransferase
MGLTGELEAALGSLTVVGRRAATIAPATAAASLAFYPIVGLALGLAAAAGAAAPALVSADVPPLVSAAAGFAVLALATGGGSLRALATGVEALILPGSAERVRERLGSPPGLLGAVVGLAMLGVRLWAAARLPDPARTAAFVLAPMLGRWAIVVQCYGGPPAVVRDAAAPIVGRGRFREFGAASVVAFAATLGLVEAAGLFVLVSAALVTVGVRLFAHRRVGGLAAPLLGATAELVETTTFVVLAALAFAPTPGAAIV